MPHLITTSGTRVPLHRGQGYIMGRGRECDVVVEDLACSRRHALITLPDGTNDAFVEDLRSRNGTHVNGDPIEARTVLRQGTRVRIGATIFLFHFHDSLLQGDVTDTGTVAYDPPCAGVEVDGGELGHYGLIELLKLLMHSKRDLSMHVALPDDNAQVEMRKGQVVAAACGGLAGFNALVKLGRAHNGIFWVVKTSDPVDHNISEPSSHLLVELARCLGQLAGS